MTQLHRNLKTDLDKKIKGELLVFTQPLIISVENVRKANPQLDLRDLQADLFYQERNEVG